MWIYLIILVHVKISAGLDPLVQTPLGLIRGLSGGDYDMFLGIPYAQVDRNNPFGDAIPHPKFGDFYAYDDTALCPQVEETTNTTAGNLDCLHLNVYVPNSASTTAPLPVIIWIHGGFLLKGFAGRYLYGPEFLIRHDVILITINYRLGPYGFMCLDIPEVPGNQGLKDQYLAIQWVRDNIKHFGGDERKITLMGESAGSKCVEAHLLTEREKVFNQVIMQSGSILGPKVVEQPDLDAPFKLAAYLGFETDDIKTALEFLGQVDTNYVIDASEELGLKFQMCVEKEFEDLDSFISVHPEHSRYETDKSILIGFNNKEMLSSTNNPVIFENPNYIQDNLGNLFNLNEKMVDLVHNFYISDENNKMLDLVDFISDFTYNYPVQRSVDRFLENEAKVFQYLFSYEGERNMVKKRLNITLAGAAHADELAYLFDLSYENEATGDDQLIIDIMTMMWTNFAKYGHPTPETTDLVPITWTPATSTRISYLNIDKELTMSTRPFNQRLTFWELFFTTYAERHKAYIYFNN